MIAEGGMRLVNTLDPGHAPEFLSFPLQKKAVFQKVISGKSPFFINNASENCKISLSGWSGYKDDSFLIFPLLDEDDAIVGVLSLHNKNQPPFIEQD